MPRRSRRHSWRHVATLLSLPGRLAPHAWRFRIAIYVARMLQPLVWLGEDRIDLGDRTRQHTRFERTLGLVLSAWHRQGVTFPLPGRLSSDLPLTGPLLILTPHSPMSQFVLRHLAETGAPVAIVRMPLSGAERIFGTDAPADVIAARPRVTMMRAAARRLSAGHILVTTVDTLGEGRGFEHPLPAKHGNWFLSDQMLRLAHRRGVPMVFCLSEFLKGRIVVKLRWLGGPDVAAMTHEIIEDLVVSASRQH